MPGSEVAGAGSRQGRNAGGTASVSRARAAATLVGMPASPLISYAQNGEDVVLWRALGRLDGGRYIEVGANDPSIDSVTRLFYDRGWSGITVEPVLAYAQAQRDARPRDTVFAVAAGDGSASTATLHVIADTGLSTTVGDSGPGVGEHDVTVPLRSLDSLIEEAGFADEDIHFLVVDVEGAEAQVIAGIDLTRFRPWILVIEATAPNSTVPTHQEWEPVLLAAGYEFALFDGLNRFYLAREHGELRELLSYPACVHDNFVRPAERMTSMQPELDRLHDLVADRDRELEQLRSDLARLRAEFNAIQQTLSWRVTRPLRAIRRIRSGRPA